MSDWIVLTPSLICETLTASQNETLGARPNQGTELDPLHVATTDAVARTRAAIRANGMNRLSADPHKIPPELKACATTLTLLRLAEIWPLFAFEASLEAAATEAENTLKAVSEATLPITLPSDPEPADTVRRSAGVSIENKRNTPIRAHRLRGL